MFMAEIADEIFAGMKTCGQRFYQEIMAKISSNNRIIP
jgi:hypothetical protein